MMIEKVRSEGLSALSYFIGSGNKAAVIDPRRDFQVYLDKASANGMSITHVFETHRNEDFASGSAALARVTGAKVIHGPGLEWGFGETVQGGEEYMVGDLRVKTLHTPGHTYESMCYLLHEGHSEDPFLAFTGDTLFVGDVGRTDMLGPGHTDNLSGSLYDSLHQRLLSIGDCVIIQPGHGAGSVCGKAISEREFSTIGIERSTNPALQILDKDDFIAYKRAEEHKFPPYFSQMEHINLVGEPLLTNLPRPNPLSPVEFNGLMAEGTVVIDTRNPACFAGGHVPGSYNMMMEGIPLFAGWFVPYHADILMVLGNRDHLDITIRYLVRLGYDRLVGYLSGGVEAWYAQAFPLGRMSTISVQDLKQMIDSDSNVLLVDVRSEEDFNEAHIPGSNNMFCGTFETSSQTLKDDLPVVVTCGIGNRGALAASILCRGGHENIYNLLGGVRAWQIAGYPVEGSRCDELVHR